MNNGNLPRNQPGLGSQHQQQQPQQQQAPSSLPQTQLNNLLRVEQIRNLPHLNDHQKTQYEGGVRVLHEALQNHPPDSPEYQAAFNKLTEVSASVRNAYKRWQQMQHQQQQQQQQQQAGAAQGQQRVGLQPQAGQAKSQGQSSHGSQSSQGSITHLSQLPPSIVAHVQQFPFTLPPNIVPGSAEGEKWLVEAKLHYAQALNKAEVAKNRIMTMTQNVQQREQAGKPLSQDEMNEFNQRKNLFTQYHAEARKFMEAVRNQQLQFKAQAQGQQQRSSETIGAAAAPVTQAEAPKLVPNRSQQQPSAAPGDHSGSQAAQNVPPGQDLAGLNTNPVTEGPPQQAGTEGRNVASPSVTAGPTLPGQVATQSPATTQPISTQPSNATPATTATAAPPANYQQFNPQQVPNTHPSVGPAVNAPRYPATHLPQGLPPQPQSQPPQQAPQNTPQSNQPPSIAQPERPQSLTHQAALTQAARSYSNGVQNNSTTPTTGGSSSQAHTATTQDVNINKMPIPKNLNIPPLQPVSMASARPTFTGGASNGANGIMNQPAVPKLPGYILEGEGERVLSKKKLDELVRQVTGGGEGLGGQLLTPECEEVSITYQRFFFRVNII